MQHFEKSVYYCHFKVYNECIEISFTFVINLICFLLNLVVLSPAKGSCANNAVLVIIQLYLRA